jgi:hypothetical protein
MLAGYSDDYMSDFVLQGCRNLDQTKLAHDLLKTVKVFYNFVWDDRVRNFFE